MPSQVSYWSVQPGALPAAGLTPSRMIWMSREPPPKGAVILAMMVPAAVKSCTVVVAETVNDWAGEVPPPGAGLNTVTWDVPAAAISAAGIAAVSWVALTTVVVRLAPFQRTVEPTTKFEPLTVRLKPAPPVVALAGASAVKPGTGLVDGAPPMVNVCAAEVPPPGVGENTLT